MNACSLTRTPDDFGILTIDQPQVKANVLTPELFAELSRLLDELEKVPLQGLLVRSGKPGMFVAGADLKELGSGKLVGSAVPPFVARGQVPFHRFENLPYPTAVLIEGPCMGGGMELALAFDDRLVGGGPRTELALPETKLGLIPGWGGTQRLPRLIGLEAATKLIVSGESLKAEAAVKSGVAAAVIDAADATDAGLAFLRDRARHAEWQHQRARKQQPLRVDHTHAASFLDAFRAETLAKTKGHLPALLLAIDVIQKTYALTIDEGLRIEGEAFAEVCGSRVSLNLIATFFETQRLAKDTGGSSGITPRPIKSVAIVGGGLMGGGIAIAFSVKDFAVTLIDPNAVALDLTRERLAKDLDGLVAKGRMTLAERKVMFDRLATAPGLSTLAPQDLAIEAIIENEETKSFLLSEMGVRLGHHPLYASNTSTISIARLGQALGQPDRFAGLHFFNPVEKMPLVEVIWSPATSEETIVTFVALAKKLGKTPIVVKDSPGFLVNRILFPYLNEALQLHAEGSSLRAIDQAAVESGLPMGPFTLMDVIGLDTTLFAAEVINAAHGRGPTSPILRRLVKIGHLGRKTNRGFYDYRSDQRRGTDDSELISLIEPLQPSPRVHEKVELSERLNLALTLEAIRVLADGITRTPADIDMGVILGLGFPQWRGGLLREADHEGLSQVIARAENYAAHGPRFEVPDLLRDKARMGSPLLGK